MRELVGSDAARVIRIILEQHEKIEKMRDAIRVILDNGDPDGWAAGDFSPDAVRNLKESIL